MRQNEYLWSKGISVTYPIGFVIEWVENTVGKEIY